MTDSSRVILQNTEVRRALNRRFAARIACLLTLWMPAGHAVSQPSSPTIDGTAFYRERIALPPDAVFEATLQDVSPADHSGVVMSRSIIEPAGQPPFHFQIRYDSAAIQPGHHYAVRATIQQQGRLLFTSTTAYRVLTGNPAPLRILLVSATSRRPPTAIAQLPASYEREMPGANSMIRWHLDLLPGGHYQLRTTYLDKPAPNPFDQIGRWQYDGQHGRLRLSKSSEPPLYFAMNAQGDLTQQLDADGKALESRVSTAMRRLPSPALIEPRLTLTGMFSYMADAASITLCEDGRTLPVAMEADYPALEKAYVNAHPQPGQAMFTSVDGLIAARPSQEESQPPRATLVVERFKAVSPGESCGRMVTKIPLFETRWKLVRLGDDAVQQAGHQPVPVLMFSERDMRISGSGGCNLVTGSFSLEGDKLRIKPLAATMRACLVGMDLEPRFLQTLTQSDRYRIQGGHLDLLDETGKVIAGFEADAP